MPSSAAFWLKNAAIASLLAPLSSNCRNPSLFSPLTFALKSPAACSINVLSTVTSTIDISLPAILTFKLLAILPSLNDNICLTPSLARIIPPLSSTLLFISECNDRNGLSEYFRNSRKASLPLRLIADLARSPCCQR